MKKTGFERVVETTSHIVIILGIIFAGLQYYTNSQQHAFNSSQSYVLHNNAERLYDARSIVFGGLAGNQLTFKELDRVYRDALIDGLLEAKGKKPIDLEVAVLTLVQFYDAVGQCYLTEKALWMVSSLGLTGTNKNCDTEVLSANFSSTINQVLRLYSFEVTNLRTVFPKLGLASCKFLEYEKGSGKLEGQELADICQSNSTEQAAVQAN